VYAFFYANIKNFPKNQRFDFQKLIKTGKAAFLSLLMPIIILGGIYLGVFTPTESASVAVAYGFIVSLLFYREMNRETVEAVILDSVKGTANIMLLVMSATIFSWFLTIYDIPVLLSDFIQGMISDRTIFLININILLLLLGMFMENGAIILILAPLIAPVATQTYGIDPVHFGLIMVFNLALGQVTPPFGTCLFAAASMSNLGVFGIARKVMPMCAVIFAVVILISFMPRLALWLPSIMIR
jgi:C4-dicarboxylate transporter DctM subunit